VIKIKKQQKLNQNSGFYLPLFNYLGLKASITPFFGGTLATDHNHYALEPVSELDLYNHQMSRNVIFQINGENYFMNGETNRQQADTLDIESGLFYQKVNRSNELFQIETTSYIPLDATVELHRIKIENNSDKALDLAVITAIPLYGRSADNLRDHRHVTSLLNRIETVTSGILLKPTLSFDERGHRENHTVYSVFAGSPEMTVKGYIPVMDDFISGGSLLFPKGLDQMVSEGQTFSGYEAMGAIAFEPVLAYPGKPIYLYLSIGIHDEREQAVADGMKHIRPDVFSSGLDQVINHFSEYSRKLNFNILSPSISNRLGFSVMQPLLRRNYGNSFLPHHDYGRGGRGWRDLWQDLISLIIVGDPSVPELLFSNFQGVRIDGSNATIIGDNHGEFKADRNQIIRVWSDHGAWPLVTVSMYVDETGDLSFLLRKQKYFFDQFTHYTHRTRSRESLASVLVSGKDYTGTIIEHLLLQTLVGFHNRGKNGYCRLEDADWNDGLDMAKNLGETVAFTNMYANNLRILSELVRALPDERFSLLQEIISLLEPDADLENFFDQVSDTTFMKAEIKRDVLANRLQSLAEERIAFIQTDAFRDQRFLGYFDNDGKPAEAATDLSLTAQAMALLNGIATIEQAKAIALTTREKLYEPMIGGYRLNTDYKRIMMNLGRAFGFAYGHKENGAVFAHMVMMYAYGLYQYGLVREGHEALKTMLDRAEAEDSDTWLGIPEYFNDRGKGKYLYLTGSASWLIKLLRTEIFGIRFHQAVMTLVPKLLREDFIDGKASITTILFGRLTKITYHNPKQLDFGYYRIKEIMVSGKTTANEFQNLTGDIEVFLDEIL